MLTFKIGATASNVDMTFLKEKVYLLLCSHYQHCVESAAFPTAMKVEVENKEGGLQSRL